jgi:hypothetical protein
MTPPIAADGGSSAPIRTPRDHEDDEQALEHRCECSDEERQRPLAPRRKVTDHEHHGLDGDPADQVAGRKAEIALCGGRHRDCELRKGARDRE